MDIKSIVTTALFGLVVSFLCFISAGLWHSLWQSFKVDQNMQLLTEAMKDLQARYDDVKVQVTLAGLEMKTCSSEVKRWLEKVESIKGEVNHLNTEFFEWRSYHGLGYLIFWKRFIISLRVLKKHREVAALRDRGAFKDIATKLPPPAAQEMPSIPRVLGMDSNRDEILQCLVCDEVKIIRVWGMGGVGKTTLLKEINNYFAGHQHPLFDHVIFVVASQGINLDKLQKKIFNNLQLPLERDDDINSRATLLFSFLKKKKILLLLDDLWKHVDLILLGIPLKQGNCKVVFTTQLFSVCRFMKAERELKVECLNWEDAWSLFEENVGRSIIMADPNIGRLAKEVVKKCHGLPRALIKIGMFMSTKKTWSEWQNALNLPHNLGPYEISGMPDAKFPILDYNVLRDDYFVKMHEVLRDESKCTAQMCVGLEECKADKWEGRLMVSEISVDTVSDLKRLAKFSSMDIVKLRIERLKGTRTLELLSPAHFGSKTTADSLKVLQIHYCRSLQMLTVNSLNLGCISSHGSLPKLEELNFRGLIVLNKIVWRGVTPKKFLPSLQSLEIDGCHRLKDVSWVLQLPNLEFLRLYQCNELAIVIGDAENSGGAWEAADRVEEPILAFPRLRKLELSGLRNLGSICDTIIPFPSLEAIVVCDCPKLMKLPFKVPNIPNKLRRILGSTEWWEHLKWEDDSTKPLLQKYFVGIDEVSILQ